MVVRDFSANSPYTSFGIFPCDVSVYYLFSYIYIYTYIYTYICISYTLNRTSCAIATPQVTLGYIIPLLLSTLKYYFSKIFAMLESIIAYACNAAGNSNVRQAHTIIESIILYARNAIGDGNACKTRAIHESAIADACDTVGDHNARKIGTPPEGISGYACNAGNSNARKTGTPPEGTRAYARNAVWERNTRKT